MAWTTPGTATAGEVLTAAFWNTQVRDNMVELAPFFSAWTTWTPTVGQGATTNITKTVNFASYIAIGKTVFFNCAFTVTGTGTAAAEVVVSYPGGIQPKNAGMVLANAWIFDSSTSTPYSAIATPSGSVAQRMAFVGDWSGIGAWGSVPNIAVANNDVFRIWGVYESA